MVINPMDVYDRAMKSTDEGEFTSALEDFVWIYNHSTDESNMYQALRRTYGLAGWVILARRYPPALKYLKDILDKNIEILKIDPDNSNIKSDVDAINENMKFL